MLCPFCHDDIARVLNTREQDDHNTKRWRACDTCHARFTTIEHPIDAINDGVISGRS